LISTLPHLNAALNATSAVLLATGFLAIRRRNIGLHRACMVATVVTSCVFLTSYLVYHAQVGSVRFQGQGWIRPVYFTILISHTVLAMTLVPLVVVTLRRASKKMFERHRAIARVTLPIWFYVSVTGVVVYLMLYHW
jgi:uncharacterized membrane protein YozB (DUF420 family)